MHHDRWRLKNHGSYLAFLLVFLSLSGLALEGPRQVLRGHVPIPAEHLLPRNYLAKSTRLNLAIGLPLRNESVLTNLIREIYDPQNPNYQHYLTPREFSERFGPKKQEFEELVDFANAHNFTVTVCHPNRLLLDVNASVEDIEKAFHVRMGVYQHPTEARTFYASDVEPSLDLAVPIRFIGGLNSYELPRPAHVRASSSAQPNSGSGPDGGYLGVDFRNAYAPGVPLTGAGQVVAMLQFDGFYSNDIVAYEALAGLPNVPLQTILIDGYNGVPSTPDGNVEVSLDVETVISMAPGISRILLYEGGPGGIPEDILSQIANDNLAKQISSSWTWQAYDPNSEATFLQFAAQGQSFFNATGDHDAFVGPITQSPSDEPYITQVGGTSLTMNSSGSGYASETVWNRGAGIGSSGGISTAYGIPIWQQAVGMSVNQGSTTMRNVPDVAMVAEGVYVKYGNGSGGSFGGTSCAAPLWAGFTALMNQQAVAAGRPTVGFLNPAIYQIGAGSNYTSCFHDVTTGNNTSSNSPTKFQAVPGYDLCTGWGTPRGSNLINAVVGPPVLGPLIVPGGIALVMESCSNNIVDPGETVRMSFGLRNLGLTSTTNLVATLQAGNGIVFPGPPQNYGALGSGGNEVAGSFTFVATGACGSTNTAVLQLHDGSANLGTVTFSIRLGRRSSTAALAQNFDNVATPALPAGWNVLSMGAGPAWATSGSTFSTSPNSAYVRDANAPSDQSLISPVFGIASSLAQLTFRHNYYTEAFFDGGVLEVSIGGAAFNDILGAGGSFVANGYSESISTCCGNPLGGRGAWSGSSGGGFITTIVNLPAAAAGQSVQLRWRFCSDNSVGAAGWYVDDIAVVDGFACCTAIQPFIQSITPSNNQVSITWNSISNRNYRVQSKTNLLGTNWTDLAGDVTAQGFSSSKTDGMGPAAQKFYRVILLP